MTEETSNRYLTDQIRALATVVLTRRDDLRIAETKEGTGLDLHVLVEREDKPMRLVFGVLLRGVPSPMTVEQANAVLRPTLGLFQGMRKFTYPVCLLFFTLRDQRGDFSWLAEPVLEGETPKLVHHREAQCVLADRELLDRIVEQVVAWYDAVETVLIA